MVQILGLGTAVPPHQISQSHTASLAKEFNCSTSRQKEVLQSIYDKTKVSTRSSVFTAGQANGYPSFHEYFGKNKADCDKGPYTLERMQTYKKYAPGLVSEATHEAIRDSNVDVNSIKHLVTVSCTGFDSPGIDIHLIKTHLLPRNISRTHIGFMGCHGFFNALRVGKALAYQHPNEKVLICSVELCTIHFAHGWNLEQVVANALFADGASAAVVSAGSHQEWEVKSCGSHVFDNTEDLMTWKVGNNGFEMSLSANVPGVIEGGLRDWISEWLRDNQLELNDVKSWAVHPGGPKILDSVENSLGLDKHSLSISRNILAEYGNMSSATIAFILKEHMRLGSKTPLVSLGFGPGLSVEATLFI